VKYTDIARMCFNMISFKTHHIEAHSWLSKRAVDQAAHRYPIVGDCASIWCLFKTPSNSRILPSVLTAQTSHHRDRPHYSPMF